MEEDWFAGSLNAMAPDGAAFVERVRELAVGALAGAISPTDTWATSYAGALVVVDFPNIPGGGMPERANTLQVRFDRGVLGGYWGCNHLWDDYDPRDPETLAVQSIPLGPRHAAELAIEWMSAQLRRPLVREEWLRGGQVLAERWVLTDTGHRLGRRGGIVLVRRKPPDRVVRLRPPQEEASDLPAPGSTPA